MAKPAEHWFLVYDHREPGHPDGPRLTRARHDHLEAAIAQAQADIGYGRNVVAIEDAEGTIVWEP